MSDAELTLRRMAAYIREHAKDSANLHAWADFIEALPPAGEEAQAFTRAQREIGFPDPFVPRCDNGIFMRTYGLKDTPPPHVWTLRELVALEGREEPLPAGAIFPLPPTPINEDGLPLWQVEVLVLSPDDDLWDRWFRHIRKLAHTRLEGQGGYGASDPAEDGSLYRTDLRVWASSEEEALAVVGALIDRVVGDAPARRRLTAIPAYPDDAFDLPHRPEDYETDLVHTRWHRCEPSAGGVKIVWYTGPCPLAKVDVEETPERVTVTLWERYPPAFGEGGTPTVIPAIGLTHCVEVPLAAPLGARQAIDGKTGAPPDEIDPFDVFTRHARDDVMALDIGTLDCVALP
jgi:hypothetical protein